MGEKIEKVLGRLLKEKKLTIAAAESFTGGLFSKVITDVPGSSAYFLGSIVSYSNFAKEKLLNISSNVIKAKGAVSKETAHLMAKNVSKILGSDIGVSFTGVAGPTNEEGKPIGLTYIGIVFHENSKIFEEYFSGSREEIRIKSVNFAIKEIIKRIGG